ncbi:MAG: GDP-mannose 4,6-dehydratase [Candidatus Woesearchaeota archaeon]
MHVLVTGGAGFIGSHLIRKLRSQNHDVDAIDNHSAGEASIRREKEIEKDKKVEVWRIDVKDTRNYVLKMLKKRKNIDVNSPIPPVDAIVHLAAPISVEESMREPAKYCKEIHGKTIALLEAAKDENVKKVVLASTAAVYGNPDKVPIAEDEKTSPLSPYAISKLAADEIARMYAREYGLETVILRLFNVYGPDQDPASPYIGFIAKCFQRARKNEPFIIFGDGNQTRDFVYVEDVVDAIISALTKAVEPGSVINIGSGKQTRIIDVAHKIAEITSIPLEIKYEPARKGDLLYSQANISKAEKILGYEPKFTLEQGLSNIWAWYKNHK